MREKMPRPYGTLSHRIDPAFTRLGSHILPRRGLDCLAAAPISRFPCGVGCARVSRLRDATP